MNDLVVVVLVNFNQNDYTIKCVDSLFLSKYDNFKVVLIDNGSTKENAEELKLKLPLDNPQFIYKRLVDNVGYAQGTNAALDVGIKLDPEYFLIMNNDTIIDEYAINELVKSSKQHDNRVIVTGKVYDYDEPDKLQIVGYQLKNKRLMTYDQLGLDEKDLGQYNKEEKRDMIDDIFVLHPVKIYKTIGGYSSFLWVNGVNIDMALRAHKIGYRLIYTPDAKLWHKGSVSIGGRNMNPKMAYWNIQSSLILRYLYLSKINFLLYYISIVESIIRTKIKSIYLKWFKNENISKYARAKYGGLIYFNKWVFNKTPNDGYNPY